MFDVEVAGNWKSGSVSQSFVNKVRSSEAFVIIYTGSIQSVLSLSKPNSVISTFGHIVTCSEISHTKNFQLCSTAKRVILISQENLSRHNNATMITQRLRLCIHIEICKVFKRLIPCRIASRTMQKSLMDIYLRMILHPSNKYFWIYLKAKYFRKIVLLSGGLATALTSFIMS